MDQFVLKTQYQPTGDQPEAIESLCRNLNAGDAEQVLLGVTGSGKTFTMANVIQRLQRPTLIISHNKTLAAQLYQEFRDYFPDNAVSYFVSYYDYYQPEAYVPSTDTYIEKETEINEKIDALRLAATMNLLTRPDTIVVASVSCIYNIGSPKEYGHFILEMRRGMKTSRESVTQRLVQLQYQRDNWNRERGTFRVRGDSIDIFPAYEETCVRIVFSGDTISEIATLEMMTGKKVRDESAYVVYPAKHYMTDPAIYDRVFKTIEHDLEVHEKSLKDHGKILEAHRIHERVTYDLEMIREMGYVNGIENYSRYFDGRKPGDAPYSLLDYYPEATKDRPGDPDKRWLLFIDESHMTVPQIRGMYHGDRSRKQTLIDYGFRLPSAMDNRPLTFDEFQRRMPQTVYVSATPDEWELSRAAHVVEQLIRPTGLIDPVITIRPVDGQINDLVGEIQKRVEIGERALVTTLTKQMAEDLTAYLKNLGVKVQYLHADVLTLDRTDILADLRRGAYDVVVGVNLLREGLDLPEVTLVAILDADKQGFLRSRTSLIQTMGRAARHIKGEVILYADTMTDAITQSVAEVNRRRQVQTEYNAAHGITPQSISKPIRDKLVEEMEDNQSHSVESILQMTTEDMDNLTPLDRERLVKRMRGEMKKASKDMDFEKAAVIRDVITALSH